jgi:geranylgeranyl pyrophosphate synthase
MARLPREKRAWLWETVQSKPQDREVIEQTIALLEECGAIQACVDESNDLVEAAWAALDPLVEPSMPKVMLRAFGWYVLERHY